MKKDDCFQLGRIIKVHGFKGEINARFEVDYPEDYLDLESVFVELNGKLIPFFISDLNYVKENIFRIKFEGVDKEEEARNLMHQSLWLANEELPELDGTDFYYHEVIGFTVFDVEFGEVGELVDILEGSAQDVFKIQINNKEILIPVVDAFIIEVNRAEKKLVLNAPDGIIDFYLAL
jgi:16S rRNA processing protein RimM